MDDAARYRANLQDEIHSAYLYRVLASLEAQPQLAAVYQQIAAVEDQHGQFWEAKLRATGQPVPPPSTHLARQNAGLHRPALWRAERAAHAGDRGFQGSHQYDDQPEVQRQAHGRAGSARTNGRSRPSTAAYRAKRWRGWNADTARWPETRCAPPFWAPTRAGLQLQPDDGRRRGGSVRTLAS